MSWLLLMAGLAWGQEGSDETEGSELDELEEQIRVAEAKLKLAQLEAQLARVEGSKESTGRPQDKPQPPAGPMAQPQDRPQPRPEASPERPPESADPEARAKPRPPDPPQPRPTPEERKRDVKDPPPKLGPDKERPPMGRQQRTERLQWGGDLRTDLVADRLDNLHPEVPEDPTLAFGVSRALVGLQALPDGPVGMVLEAEAANDFTTTSYATGAGAVDVQNSPSGWRFRLLDAYARADLAGGELRVGNQYHVFGSGTFSRREDTWYMAGHLFREPAHEEGLIEARVLGISYGRDLGEMLRVDAQLSNTSMRETRLGKDLTLRLGVRPNDMLRASGSVLVGPGAGSATKVQYSGVVQGSLANTHALLEIFGQQGMQAPVLGASAHLVQDIPVARSESLDRVSLAGRVHWFDPDTGLVADHHTTIAAGTNLWLQPLPRVWLIPCAGWEMVVPDDLDLAIEHRVIAQLRLDF
jgi:hypothetical protein